MQLISVHARLRHYLELIIIFKMPNRCCILAIFYISFSCLKLEMAIMRVLVIGGGGREHALVWKISQSPKVEKVYCAPGNAGTSQHAENVDIPAEQIDRLLAFAHERKIDLTVVGPEQPLAMGIVDLFRKEGLRIFGPTAMAARIEGSKIFAKDLMREHGIPTGDYRVFTASAPAKDYVRGKGRIIVKADGLAAGKGVYVCKNGDEAAAAIEQILEQNLFGDAGRQIIVEEFLEGQEVSLLAFTDGKTVLPLESAQDHKTVYDGDQGPNTGGMGTYSPAPMLTSALLDRVMGEIMYPTVTAMAAKNCPYQGILYAGLMMTAAGPKVLEFNARFGDPETQPLLMRLQSDIVPIMEACVDGTLAGKKALWNKQAAVCVVMAAGGYPGTYAKGDVISGLDSAAKLPGVMVFHAGTKQANGQVATNGGRALGVTALGDGIADAVDKAYGAVSKINWRGVHYRKDIGRRKG
jgi:phosphoribosylamine--glycine ligase